MHLPAGTRIGPYEVTAPLGAGGMGEVYRARDARLNRDVALKVLPDLFANDPERLARFSREAQALAALNHPNIAAIYGIEGNALVMELVEGVDLSDLIRSSGAGLPLDDAVGIARQIADALEAAHEQGIIHRDLKPANIKVRADGTVKVLDFGLAKAMDPGTSGSQDASNSPTLTARATQMGMIIGTAAYMAPEQAKGKAVDRRADIWAFGVVLYEMLTGRRAFEGEDVSTTLAAVLMKDPEWDALPASTPTALRRLVLRCLERDPRLRLRDIGEARVLLSDPAALREALPAATAAAAVQPVGRSLLPWIIAAAAVIGAAATVTTPMFRAAPVGEPVQFNVSFPPNVRPLSNGSDYQGGQISPDGRYVAFSGADMKTAKVGIYVRTIDATEPRLIKGTEGGRYPFWAPTSRTIAFYAQGKLYRVDIDGTSLLLICDAPTGGWGGAWNRDDIIIAGVTDPGPLVKVSAKGGDTPTPVTKITLPENDHDWPQFLPDGRHFVYTAWSNTFTGTASAYVASLDSQDHKLLLKDLLDPVAYADPGFILFIRNGTLLAQPLDPQTFQLQGQQAQVASNAMGPISSSANGTVAYTTTVNAALSRLAWANRDGSDERPLTDAGFYRDPAVSPDGTRIAYARKESFNGTFDVYVRDIATGSERRLTYDPADDRSPVWSPDSKELIFSAARNPHGLYRKNANGSGTERPLTVERMPQIWSYQWNSEGYVMAYGDTEGSWDIWKVSLTDPKPTPLLTSRTLNEARGAVSPDGKWLAYDARETARFEVFLDTFPPSGSKLSITTEGGAEPKWSTDGKELFYVSSATGALMSVPVTLSDPPTFGTHRQVHSGPLQWGWGSSHSFDLDQRTGRVVMGILEERGDLTVLLNWRALMRK
jgi:Tol biopolymer transport system component